MPTHNRADVVGAAIQSVLIQSESSFELLVVGDGCTDDTAEVVGNFADQRIVWFDLPKAAGFGYANRNVALEKARGDLIAYAAHDDILLPDHLEKMKAHFFDPHIMWAYSRPLWIEDDGTVFPFFINLTGAHALKPFMEARNHIPASNVVHRRKCFEDVGYWDPDVKVAGDWDMWKRIIRHYGPQCIAFEREPTIFHFRAFYRPKKRWGSLSLHAMRIYSTKVGEWPKALVIPIQENSPLPVQDQLWSLIELDPPIFAAELRNGVRTLQDDMSWFSEGDLGQIINPSRFDRIMRKTRSMLKRFS